MAAVTFAPFIGEWAAGTFYARGSVVYLSTTLYQAQADTTGQDPSAGWPSWVNVTAVPMELYGTADPTAGDGIPAALGSTYVYVGTGAYTKTDATATDWTSSDVAAHSSDTSAVHGIADTSALIGVQRALALTYVSGTGTAGMDNTAQAVITRTLPGGTLTQNRDRMRLRAFWRGDTGTAVTGTIKVNGVPVADFTDGGGATLFNAQAWLHYIDNTHANIMEEEGGGLGALSDVNVAGFDWDSDQDITVEQDQVANNHIVVYALFIDIIPKGM